MVDSSEGFEECLGNVFRQKWRKTGKLRETNYEKVFSVCKIERTLFLL